MCHNNKTQSFFLSTIHGNSRNWGYPSSFGFPNPRLHPDKFRDGIRGMSQRSGLDWIFTESSLEPILTPLLVNSTIKGMHFPLEWNLNYRDAKIESELKEIRKNREGTDPFLSLIH